ncbi:MAG: hypothetical protein WBM62_08615, partial [Crocosphaera sp.]
MNSVKKLINLSVISTGFTFLNICPSLAVTIGFFNNPDFSFGEADTLFNILVDQGNTVTQFSSLEASVWQEIADNNQVLVIPTINNNSLFPSLSSETQTVIANYVDNGGGFLMAGEVQEVIPVMNGVFGFSLAEDFFGQETLLNPEDAEGTIFENAPSSLPNAVFTTTMAIDSLPLGSLNFYDNEQNSSSVFVSPFGLGKVAFNG